MKGLGSLTRPVRSDPISSRCFAAVLWLRHSYTDSDPASLISSLLAMIERQDRDTSGRDQEGLQQFYRSRQESDERCVRGASDVLMPFGEGVIG